MRALNYGGKVADEGEGLCMVSGPAKPTYS